MSIQLNSLIRNLKLIAVSILLFEGLAAPGCKKSDIDLKINGLISSPVYTKIFTGGTDGYHSYRIPSIVRTTTGMLIAFCEGRADNNKDYGNIDVVRRRSSDNGITWSSQSVIAGRGTGTLNDGTFGNPTAVVDESNGTIWLFMSWNDFGKNQNGDNGKIRITAGDRPVFVSKSTDDGKTWSVPANITGKVQPAGMAWDAVGPGTGIQTNIANNGRLIIPAIGRNIYSDDHGLNWTYARLPGGTSESTIVELSDGSLLRNDRAVLSTWENAKRRWISRGTAINSFSPFEPADELPDPRCEAAMLRYRLSDPNYILFLNSASTSTRLKMRIRVSSDDGKTWFAGKNVYDSLTDKQQHEQGKGGYCSLVKTADSMIGALIENNEDVVNKYSAHMSVEFVRFNLPWVLNNASGPEAKN